MFQKGHEPSSKKGHNNRREGRITEAIEKATKKGHLDIATWLQNNRTDIIWDGDEKMAVDCQGIIVKKLTRLGI